MKEALSKEGYLARKNRLNLRNTKIDLDFLFEDQILRRNLLELDDKLVNRFFEDINTFLQNQIELFKLKIKALKDESNMMRNCRLDDQIEQNLLKTCNKQYPNALKNSKIDENQIDAIEIDDVQKTLKKQKDQKLQNHKDPQNDYPTKKKYKKFDYDVLCYNQEELEQKRTYRQYFEKIGENKFQCKMCNKQLVNVSHCYNHWNKFHTNQIFNCSNCWLSFSTFTDLFCHDFVRHDPDHSIQSNEIIPCEYCGKDLKARSTYNKHILRIHIGELQNEMEKFKKKYYANNENRQKQSI